MNSSTVLVARARQDRVAVVTLNRPEASNALNIEMADALTCQLQELAQDKAVRVVVLTATGNRAFCAGADLKERLGMAADQWRAQHEVFERTFGAVLNFAKPIIAAINGVAAGGGLELALSADFMLASQSARFGQPEVRRGIMPGGGAPQLLPLAVPLGLARQLLITGELIDAKRALMAGLVNSVHPDDDLINAALDMAEVVARNSPAAVQGVLRAVDENLGVPVAVGNARALDIYYQVAESPDRYEGIAAYNERREPMFADI